MSAKGSDRKTTKEKTRIDWETPPAVVLPVIEALGLTLDAATSGASNSRLPYFLQGPCWGRMVGCQCGLCFDWGSWRVWCNPPYGQTEVPKWTNKAAMEWANNGTVSALCLPNNTETGWYEMLWESCSAIVQLHGRVPFIAPPGHEEEGEERTGNTGGSIVAVYLDDSLRTGDGPRTLLWRWKVDKYFPIRR